MNQKYIQSHNQKKFNEERKVNDKTFLYTFLVTGALYGIAFGLGYIHKDKGFINPNDNNYTNRLEKITR